jgi:Spx/MgsR family transcriptional regulator
MKFYWKPNCSTCRKTRSFLREQGATLEEIDLNGGLTVAELDSLIGARDYRLFLNSRNELYRERRMKQQPPTRAQALQLMSRHPNLIKRPIAVKGGKLVLGWNEAELRSLL